MSARDRTESATAGSAPATTDVDRAGGGSAPADIAARIDDVRERSGFVPNVFSALAAQPDLFRSFFTLHDQLMDKDSAALSKADRELIAVVTSAENRCTYCVVAHGAVLRIRDKDVEIADQVAVDWRKAPLDERRRVLLDYATRLARTPEVIGPEDAEALRAAGFSDDDVWDIVAIVGFFALSNRLAHAFDIRPNAEFFDLGRHPRAASAAPSPSGPSADRG